MPRNYWMVVTSKENFDIMRGLGFTIQGVKAQHNRKVQRIEPGDCILYYIGGKRHFAATARATSRYSEDQSPPWKQDGLSRWAYKVGIQAEVVLADEEFMDACQIAPRLDYVRKWAPESWYIAFAQTNLHLLPKKDFMLLEQEMRKLRSKSSRRGSYRAPDSRRRREPSQVPGTGPDPSASGSQPDGQQPGQPVDSQPPDETPVSPPIPEAPAPGPVPSVSGSQPDGQQPAQPVDSQPPDETPVSPPIPEAPAPGPVPSVSGSQPDGQQPAQPVESQPPAETPVSPPIPEAPAPGPAPSVSGSRPDGQQPAQPVESQPPAETPVSPPIPEARAPGPGPVPTPG